MDENDERVVFNVFYRQKIPVSLFDKMSTRHFFLLISFFLLDLA